MFTIDHLDKSGRSGKLDLDGIKIDTPTILPTKNEGKDLIASPYLKPNDIKDFKVGVHTQWIWLDKLSQLRSTKGYNYVLRYVTSQVKEIPTSKKMLHFEFGRDVDTLDTLSLDLLLQLQLQSGANVIEVPNSYHLNVNYNDTLDHAINWHRGLKVDIPLMGLICDDRDVPTLKSKIKDLNCFGLSMRRESIPLLYQIRNELKKEAKWIHSFSTHKAYSAVRREGTLGPLINFFGIDTLSTYVVHPFGIKKFIAETLEEGKQAKQARADQTTFFNPQDYGKPKYDDLATTYGKTHPLSNFCPCPVCKNNTIGTITSNYLRTFHNTRVHEIVSYSNESKRFRKELDTGNPETYIKNRNYPSQIIRIP